MSDGPSGLPRRLSHVKFVNKATSWVRKPSTDFVLLSVLCPLHASKQSEEQSETQGDLRDASGLQFRNVARHCLLGRAVRVCMAIS